jgi:hypothetical protein
MGVHSAQLNTVLAFMTKRGTSHLFALAALGVGTALGQPAFKVLPSNKPTLEGGNVSVLLVQTGGQRFSLAIPRGYGTQVRSSDQSIVFTAGTGSSVITVQVSTNYPGSLPKTEILRDTVAAKHPLASLVQTSPCPTQCGSGLLFDLFQPAGGNVTLRLRDAYVSIDEGSVEFTLSCDLADYDKARVSYAWLLNSFHSVVQPVKKES